LYSFLVRAVHVAENPAELDAYRIFHVYLFYLSINFICLLRRNGDDDRQDTGIYLPHQKKEKKNRTTPKTMKWGFLIYPFIYSYYPHPHVFLLPFSHTRAWIFEADSISSRA